MSTEREVIDLLLDRVETLHHEILKLRAKNNEKWEILEQLDRILREHGYRLTDIKDYPARFREIINHYYNPKEK